MVLGELNPSHLIWKYWWLLIVIECFHHIVNEGKYIVDYTIQFSVVETITLATLSPAEKASHLVKKLIKETSELNYKKDFRLGFAYPTKPYPAKKNITYYTLPQAISKYKVKNTVLLMLTDYGYIDQFWNSYVVSKLHKVPNLVVACIDVKAYELLSSRGVQVAFVDISVDSNHINTQVFTEQESASFKEKLQWKLNILLTALQCDVKLLYMDADIVLLRDPFPYFERYTNLDFVAQKDITVCTGFLFMWPTQKTMQMIDIARRIRGTVDGGDQAAVLTVLDTMSIRYELLPSQYFMSGEVFFSQYQFFWDVLDPTIYMYHNNYVRGKEMKEYRSKEMRTYTLNRDNDYSSMSERYFTIQFIPSTKSTIVGADRGVYQAITEAVKVANALNRTLVIPPITCKHEGTSFCNMCYFEYVNCFSSLLKQLNKPFKESVFFNDTRVPLVYRNEFKTSVVYDFDWRCVQHNEESTFPAYKGVVSQVVCLPCKKSISSCIIQQLKHRTDRIIKVYRIV